MSDFWRSAACRHTTTTQANAMGDALCAVCGSLVRIELTEAGLLDTFERVRRDHGSYGRHSMRCVDTEHGWVCAGDCTVAAPSTGELGHDVAS